MSRSRSCSRWLDNAARKTPTKREDTTEGSIVRLFVFARKRVLAKWLIEALRY
jgi:hypothetical protein